MTTWRYIEDDGVSADFGLAADEYLMGPYGQPQCRSGATLRLYTYRSHCALVGRYQNLEAELDLQACAREGIGFSRRPTGGGAIIMGADQLGLCLTTSGSQAPGSGSGRPAELYRRFAVPLISVLQELGIEAAFRSRNDLEVGGRKIAGLGVYYDASGALLFHTSLLVDLNVPLMLRVLRVPAQKLSDKAQIRSVAQRITTVSRELRRGKPRPPQPRITVADIRPLLRKSFEMTFGVRLKEQPFSDAERLQIERLAAEKYRSREWLYQRLPQADMTGMSLMKTPAGLLRTYIGLKGEVIKSVLITGDFFEHHAALQRIENRLKWSAFDKEQISAVVRAELGSGESADLPPEAVTDAIWSAGRKARRENFFNYHGSCYYPQTAKTAVSE